MYLHAKDFSCKEEGISPIHLKLLVLYEQGFQVHIRCISESNCDAYNDRNISMLDRIISEDG
jgi:hypothetical protein